ncbi:MAG: CCA tRNA nucleotidyltransferase [Erysipelotrichia bacterium]|nr:CCA tRNA nucleotidyltransferase [Erysipelotrichia bacterium]
MIVPALPEYAEIAIRILEENGHSAYVVGGAVRNALLKLPVHDYDLTTDATPAEMTAVFHNFRIIPTGIRHGTITVMISQHPVEITTFRTETAYEDHRHPDQVLFTRTLKEDCARRDFTINAMCFNPKEGIIDYYGGSEDLKNRLIRTVGDPELRFNEDALRILRALRMAAELGFALEEHTSQAILNQKNTLSCIAAERIDAEFLRMLKADYCRPILKKYRTVIEVFLPELKQASEAQWNQACSMIGSSGIEEGERLAILLHICGCDDTAAQCLRHMKVSTLFSATVLDLIQHADVPLKDRCDVRKLMHSLKAPFAMYADFRTVIDPSIEKKDLLSYRRQIINDQDVIQLNQLNLKGTDLQEVGYIGPGIAKALSFALDGVMGDKVINRKENLMGYLKTNGF